MDVLSVAEQRVYAMGDMADDAIRAEENQDIERQIWQDCADRLMSPHRVTGSEIEDDGLCHECGEPLGYIHYFECDLFMCNGCLEKECVCND